MGAPLTFFRNQLLSVTMATDKATSTKRGSWIIVLLSDWVFNDSLHFERCAGELEQPVHFRNMICNINSCVYIMFPCLHVELPLHAPLLVTVKTLCQLHQAPSKVSQAFRIPCLFALPLCYCDQFSWGPTHFEHVQSLV